MDCNFISGNCFYFAQILLSRFPQGEIYYDVINGHFVFRLDHNYYDWTGCIEPDGYLVKWSEFEDYVAAHYKIIVWDCIM